MDTKGGWKGKKKMAESSSVNFEEDGKKGIRETFTPYHEEIKRRAKTAKSKTASLPGVTRFERVEGEVDHPFQDATHSFVLFSTSHVGMRPFSFLPSEPALRIYGTFATTEEAMQHAAVVQQCDPGCDIQMDETHKWIVGCSTKERLAEGEAVEGKREAVLKKYVTERRVAANEFVDNVSNQLTGGSVPKKEEEEEGASCEGKQKAPLHISRMAEVRDQSVVILSCLPDEEGSPPEFLFKVYRCCSSEAEADAFIRNVAAVEVTDFDLDVVNSCEWVYPQQATGEKIRKEVYRDPELGKIMTSHKTSGSRVADFEKWKEKEEGMTPAEAKASTAECEGADLISAPEGFVV